MLCHRTILIEYLLEVTADMYHAVNQPHIRVCLEGHLIAYKIFTLVDQGTLIYGIKKIISNE